MNKCLSVCRSCCKFKKKEVYFAPKITKKEIAKIKSSGLYQPVFVPFKNSEKVFQISLTKSKTSNSTFVCPFLNEKTQLCNIYKIRPFDCAFWPFILMYDKKKNKILVAHVTQESCLITNELSKTEFETYYKKNANKWINKKNITKLTSDYPDLIWDYETNTFVVEEIKPTTKKQRPS